MSKVVSEVEDDIKKVLARNKHKLNQALIKPIHKNHPFSSNGLYCFIGRPGSGKTFYIMKHILLSERLFEKPYYNLIVFCSTSNGLDKTVLAFKDKIKTPMLFINDSELMDFLAEHIKEKMRYYSIYRFVMNNLKKPDELMQRVQTNRYPMNCLVVLDDFANNELLTNRKSSLHTCFTKTRHYNITFIIAVQTVKFVPKNVKRMLSDVVINRLLSEEDFFGLMKELSIGWNIDKLYQECKIRLRPKIVR